jgi:hypothetical protein
MITKPPVRLDAPLPARFIGGRRQQGDIAMAYGHSTAAFIENGPAEQLARAEAARSTARSWRALDNACRLAIVERALSPANDRVDAFSIAL